MFVVGKRRFRFLDSTPSQIATINDVVSTNCFNPIASTALPSVSSIRLRSLRFRIPSNSHAALSLAPCSRIETSDSTSGFKQADSLGFTLAANALATFNTLSLCGFPTSAFINAPNRVNPAGESDSESMWLHRATRSCSTWLTTLLSLDWR